MIDLDKNRKTFRSNVKSRSGERLPGMEMYHQGLDVKEANISRGMLPIIGRGGYIFEHEYDIANVVYESVQKEDEIGLEKIIDIQLGLNTATDTPYEPQFVNLVGQTFEIRNPKFLEDPTEPEYWTFEFTSDVGVDPRLHLQESGLHDEDIGRRGFDIDASMRYHLLRPLPRTPEHVLFEIEHESTLTTYGEAQNNGNYKIPVGYTTTAFPSGQYGSRTGSEEIDEGNLDLGDGEVFNRLASNAWWLYAVITRSIYNVLPSYFEILSPNSETQYLNVQKEQGALDLWDVHSLSDISSNPPVRIKLRYSKEVPVTALVTNNSSNGNDISLTAWDFTKGSRWAKEGHRVVQREPNVFYEDIRTDFLKQTMSDSIILDSVGVLTNQAARHFYSPQRSKGALNPTILEGDEISKYEEKLEATLTPDPAGHVSEHVSIVKSQMREKIPNSYIQDFSYYEDVHYKDPDQENWTALSEHYRVWIDLADHGGDESAAFLQHLENMFDNRYVEMRLMPEAPMSGRIDVFDSFRSYSENMPETVLWNTRKSTSARSHDLESTVICVDTWPKKSEEIDVKKFEDLRGKRNPELVASDYNSDGSLADETSVMFVDYFDQQEPDVLDYVEEERWTRIDDEMMVFLTQGYWDHDNDSATPEVQTGRSFEIDRRNWQQSDYLYANTGHTTVHFQRVNGIVSQEHKR